MKKKAWYKSQTIQAQIVQVVVAVGALFYPDISEDRVAQAVAAIGVGVPAIFAVDGRRKADTPLGLRDADEDFEIVGYIAEEPDKDYISSLPGPVTPAGWRAEATVSDDVFIPPNLESDSEEFDALELDFSELKDRKYYIKALQTTKLKNSVKDSSTLTVRDYAEIKKDEQVDLDSWKYSEENNHIEVTLASDPSTTYFAYAPHIELYNVKNKKVDIAPIATDNTYISTSRKTPISLPGFTSTFYLEDPIVPKGHFTWSEATKGGTRLPESSNVVNNIVNVAKELESIRSMFGNRPITITSWYRPPAVNRAVGGASRSQHLQGHAVDFFVIGLDIWEVQKTMENKWRKGGLGLGAAKGFVHIDLANYRVWGY